MKLLLINGATRADGNTSVLLDRAKSRWSGDVDEFVCADAADVEAVVAKVEAADAFVVGSGVYWSSWGAPLQRFLEVMTAHELSPICVGKPIGVVLSMDSVGGFDVAARLLFSFSCLGCVVPPAAAVIVSRTGAALRGQPGFDDVWQIDDVDVLVDNIKTAATIDRALWTAWPIERTRAVKGAWPTGSVDFGTERFLEPSNAALKKTGG